MKFSTVIKKILLLLILLLGVFFVPQSVMAQAAPSAPGNVLVTYPACDGANCNNTQAKCTWDAATGAASYTVKITEIDSNTIIASQSLASSVLTYTFPVTSGKTYKCEVNAVNSAGTAGAAGSYSLLCQTDVAVPTAVPTTVGQPANTPIPSERLIPPVTGSATSIIFASIFILGILAFGGILFIL